MKLELKVEQANSSSDEDDLDVSQSSSDIVSNRKVSWQNAHVAGFKVYLLVFAEQNRTQRTFFLCLSSIQVQNVPLKNLLFDFFWCNFRAIYLLILLISFRGRCNVVYAFILWQFSSTINSMSKVLAEPDILFWLDNRKIIIIFHITTLPRLRPSRLNFFSLIRFYCKIGFIQKKKKERNN